MKHISIITESNGTPSAFVVSQNGSRAKRFVKLWNNTSVPSYVTPSFCRKLPRAISDQMLVHIISLLDSTDSDWRTEEWDNIVLELEVEGNEVLLDAYNSIKK